MDVGDDFFQAVLPYDYVPRRRVPLLFMSFDKFIIAGNPLAGVIDGDSGDLSIMRNKTTGGLEIEPYGPNTVAGGGSIPYQTQFQNEGVRNERQSFALGPISNANGSIDNTTWFQNEFNDKGLLSSLFQDCPCNQQFDGSGSNPPVETQTGYGGIGFGAPNDRNSPDSGGGGLGNPFGPPAPPGTGGAGGGPGFGWTPPNGGGPL